MLSTTALITFCLLSSLVAAQQPLIFASPSSSAAPALTTSASNQQSLVFATSPSSFDNHQSQVPRFATSGSTQNGAPVFAASVAPTSSLEPRQASQAAFASSASQNPSIAKAGFPAFASLLTTARSLQSDVGLSGPPVFATSSSTSANAASSTTRNDASIIMDNLLKLSQGAEKFCLEFLAQISNEHLPAPRRSYMVSPLSVWSLLILLNEGAEANTLVELRRVLNLQDITPQALRAANRQISSRLNARNLAVEVAAFQALFTDINKPVSRDFENIIEREYLSTLTPVDFADVNTTFVRINNDINKATRGLLPYSVLPQDLIDVELLMMSSLYFKGKWRHPFEVQNTHWAPFYDEAGEVTGNVEMMTQLGDFTYAQVKELQSHILELPYGVSNTMSMLIVFPKKGVSLNSVMTTLPKVGISTILQQLDEELQLALHDDVPREVEVFLPKFTTQSHFSIRYILENMGLVDIFQPAYANLSKISKDTYVSSIFQSTRIIVNEEGTEAAAVAIATLVNKASPVKFYIDRPFAYLIVERTANLLLFAGEIKSHM